MKQVSFVRMVAAGLTLSLGLVAGVANAATISFTPIGPNFWATGAYTNVAGGFLNNFDFTIPVAVQPVAEGVSATISAGNNVTFTGFNLWDYTTSSVVAIGTAITPGSWQVNFTIPSSGGHLLTNSYGFLASGSSVGGYGSYSLDANITAVPEPETYAMLLAGLGLLGFTARRRKINS